MDCSTGAALATEEWMFFDVGGPVAGAESVILVLDESPDEGLWVLREAGAIRNVEVLLPIKDLECD